MKKAERRPRRRIRTRDSDIGTMVYGVISAQRVRSFVRSRESDLAWIYLATVVHSTVDDGLGALAEWNWLSLRNESLSFSQLDWVAGA